MLNIIKNYVKKFINEKRADFGFKEIIALLVVVIIFALALKIFFPYLSDTLMPVITDNITDMFDYFS
ncbi:MAG: hypothetical protein IJ593_05685 [Lachnospiraceae bacterium]|nr:hypothetical protein [Lachnospiraceae bacterium]